MPVVGGNPATTLIPSGNSGQVIPQVVDAEFGDKSRCIGVQLGLGGGDGGFRGGGGVRGVYRGGTGRAVHRPGEILGNVQHVHRSQGKLRGFVFR